MAPEQVLLLPGWHNSGPGHWQTLWQQRHGYRRVEQHDWVRPLRGDWIARLDEVLLSMDAATSGPTVLVAHSLGCLQVAAWAAHSRHTHRVKGALLVAPADTEQPPLCHQLPSWTPIVRQRLPFAAYLLSSSDDPFCTPAAAAQLARDWGAALIDTGSGGHLNAESGLGEFALGHDCLQRLMAR